MYPAQMTSKKATFGSVKAVRQSADAAPRTQRGRTVGAARLSEQSPRPMRRARRLVRR
jgi:hypothetical protein